MAVDCDRAYQALRNLDSERALRNLLERELGYDYKGDFLSGDDLPEDAAGELAGDPKLYTSTAIEGQRLERFVGQPEKHRLTCSLKAGRQTSGL